MLELVTATSTANYDGLRRAAHGQFAIGTLCTWYANALVMFRHAFAL